MRGGANNVSIVGAAILVSDSDDIDESKARGGIPAGFVFVFKAECRSLVPALLEVPRGEFSMMAWQHDAAGESGH